MWGSPTGRMRGSVSQWPEDAFLWPVVPRVDVCAFAGLCSMTNASSFPQVYRRFLAPVRAKCRRIIGTAEAAEDIAQEAFARLLGSGPDVASSETRTILAWLYLTATRLAIDALRANRRGVRDTDVEAHLPPHQSPHEVLEARRAIEQMCVDTPSEELEAAVLCRVDGLSQPEAALTLGVSERTLRRLLQRFDERTVALRRTAS